MLASLLGESAIQADASIDFENQVCYTSSRSNSNTEVVGRSVFYNDSLFDGNDPGISVDDDNAIASDKVAFFPGETATFENYTSFSHGINGIIVDAFLNDATAFSANDIILKAGAGNELSDYERIDVLPTVSVRPGEGTDGSDRITIVLPNGSVVNEYLQVTVLANQTTGLTDRDVFYFGNVVADTGNSTSDAIVDTLDVGSIRENFSGFNLVDVDNEWDVNRDRRVDTLDIGTIRQNFTGFTSVPLITAPVLGNDFLVGSAAEIDAILSEVQPGDTITLEDGVWTDQQIHLCATAGTEARPVTLRAQTPGQVILNGESTLNIGGNWVVADGLNFNGGALDAGDHVVEFRDSCGDGTVEATNSRLTNSAIIDYNPSDINTRYFWVSLYGQNNRVDHSSFSGQNHSGVTVTVWRDNSDADHHLIDNNYFANRPEGNGNGFETIRIGTSAESLSSSFTTVEYNLFEQTDGEIEIISNKSGDNIFRYNTFRESAGTLTLRHGDNNRVEGNFFLGGGKDRTGGVRVIGENQTVINNYFERLDGRADGAISISAAVPNSPLNGYYQVRDAVIAHNTIVDVNNSGIIFNHGFDNDSRTLLAEDVTIANNLIFSTQDPLFEGNEGSNWTWEGNIAFGQSLGPKDGDSGITVVDPQLVKDANGFWRLDSSSPAIDGGSGDYSSVLGSLDIDGQMRVAIFDVGADEASTAATVRRPLVAGDVGNYWMRVAESDNGGGDPSGGSDFLAIQSDEFASALDPNGDEDTWTIVTEADALGGTTLVAPEGNRVNLPGTHDAVVTYDLSFAETGTYTFYFRARGFSGSTDSLYLPDGFGEVPDIQASLSTDGTYQWQTGGTFDIAESDVGVSQEFRIGKRERDAEFDAFVFHPDASLTAAELDALFE